MTAKKVVPWRERLYRALVAPVDQFARGADLRALLDEANTWVVCACGQQDERIPRYAQFETTHAEGTPKDRVLRALGIGFANAVNYGIAGGLAGRQADQSIFFVAALRILEKIEARAKKILTMQFIVENRESLIKSGYLGKDGKPKKRKQS